MKLDHGRERTHTDLQELAMAEEVKLHGMWGSPFSRRAELALRLKGVAFEYLDEDYGNKSPELLIHNPIYKKVPVLRHGGRTVVESAIVLQYIDETWPESHRLLPEDPYQKSQARFWVTFIDDKCIPALWHSCWTQGEEQQSFMKQAKEGLGYLEKELEGKKFFGGDSIGFVDIAAGFIAFWAPALQEATGTAALIDKDEHPNLCRWTEDFLGSQEVKESLPERERFVAYFKAKKEAESAAKAPSTT